jgi:RNA methyltransferase, TrmH family
MQHISSADNPLLKQIARLQRKPTAYRDEGVVLLEGEHLILEWLTAGRSAALHRLLLSESGSGLPAWLRAKLADDPSAALQEKLVIAPHKLLSRFASGEHTAHVFALLSLPQMLPASLCESTVLLQGVQDAGNVGTILRTAAAAGFKQVLLDENCAAAWSPKVLRAAMGAHTYISIYELANINHWISEATIDSIAADIHAKNSIYDEDLRMSCAWLFGSEGQGIAPESLALCTRKIKIPQANVESLNVASAAAICLFESVRQSRQQN